MKQAISGLRKPNEQERKYIAEELASLSAPNKKGGVFLMAAGIFLACIAVINLISTKSLVEALIVSALAVLCFVFSRISYKAASRGQRRWAALQRGDYMVTNAIVTDIERGDFFSLSNVHGTIELQDGTTMRCRLCANGDKAALLRKNAQILLLAINDEVFGVLPPSAHSD